MTQTPLNSAMPMAGIITQLSETQQQIFRWLMRHRDSNVHQIAAHIQQSVMTTQVLLQDMVATGAVEKRFLAGESVYRAKPAAKSGRKLPETIHQSLLPGSPIAAVPNPSGQAAVVAGSKLELRVTVSNKGLQAALIDVYLSDLDETAPISQWCSAHHERLALGSQQSSEVIFTIDVPVQAMPSTYPYRIVVDAPQHYPEDTPITYDQQLQVTAPITDAVRVHDPTFTVAPVTASSRPVPLLPGEAIVFEVLVHNRSDRVDRFRVSCPDLEAPWYSVQYPEGLALPGLVIEADGLPLNPGDRGTIAVTIQPPPGTLAGPYFPTLRLHSANDPALALLDVVYVEVLPSYDLGLEWVPRRDQVKQEAGEYELYLTNRGNTERSIQISLADSRERPPYTYTLSDDEVEILAGGTSRLDVQVHPRPRWRRPLWGGGRLLSFDVVLADPKALPLTPDRYQGTLLWQPRPWWQLALLVLTGLGIAGTLLLAAWLLFLKPPAAPKILSFQSADTSYEAARGDAVRLSWRIRHPQRLGMLQLVGRSPDGMVLSPATTYSFAAGIPAELSGVCEQVRQELICQNVLTDARQAGDYIFELSAFLQKDRDDPLATKTTDTIRLLPVGQPQVMELTPAELSYPSAEPDSRATLVPLTWKVTHPDQIRLLRLVGRRDDGTVTSEREWDFQEGIPDDLKTLCDTEGDLVCEQVKVPIEKSGTTVMEMTAIPKREGDAAPHSLESEPIVIEALPPEILTLQVNGEEAGPGYIVELDQDTPRKQVLITWEVAAEPGAKVELLPAPGLVEPQGSLNYTVSQQSGRETITLKVTPEVGEAVSRSLVLEVFDAAAAISPQPPVVNLPPPPGTTPGPGSVPGAPPLPPLPRLAPGGRPSPSELGVPSDPLTPSEVPPQFD